MSVRLLFKRRMTIGISHKFTITDDTRNDDWLLQGIGNVKTISAKEAVRKWTVAMEWWDQTLNAWLIQWSL